MAKDRRELLDAKFAVKAVKEHIALFGKAPRAYAYDRGGWSATNIAEEAGSQTRVELVG